MNAITVPQQQTLMQALVPRNVPEAVQLAETFASASLVPEHLRGNPGDCLLVVMQAQRWGMDALSVAQCTSVVHGRLCYEGKLVAAVLYSMGAVDGRLRYEIKGSGQGASITVTGTPRGGDGTQSVSGSVKDWRTLGKDKQGNRIDNAWDKIPEDMLVYRGTRQWARRYAPEALLGVYTPDEMEDAEPVQAAVVIRQERPAYPQSDFDANVGKWREIISSGRKTADDIIAMVESKGTLTDEQREQIRTGRPPDAVIVGEIVTEGSE